LCTWVNHFGVSVICKGKSHKILHIDINIYIYNVSFTDNSINDYKR